MKACVFSTIFALGLHATREDAVYLARRRDLLARSLAAAYVLTPLIAVLLARIFAAPPAVEIGLLLLAISAGAPALPKKLMKLGGSTRYVYSLQVLMALLAVVTVPVSLALLRPFLPKAVMVSGAQVAGVVTTAFLAPLLAGMVVHCLWPKFAARIRTPLMSLAGLVLLGVVVLILATNFSAITSVGLQGFLIIALLTFGALAVGHVIGGPDSTHRTTLALACATRSPALVLLIASLNFPNAKPLPIVAAYLLISNLAVIPYVRWRKNRSEVDRGRNKTLPREFSVEGQSLQKYGVISSESFPEGATLQKSRRHFLLIYQPP